MMDGGKRFDRDKAMGAGGPPGHAVLGEAAAGHNVMDMRVILQVPAPGVEDAGEPRKVGPDEALVVGQPLEGRCRRLQQGVVREAVMRADEGAERLRDRKGEEEVRPRELFVEVVLKPLLRCMLLALGAVAVATRMLDAVLSLTVWALREAMAVRAAAAVLDGTDDLAVCGGEVGRARKGLRGEGVEDSAEGRQAWQPRLSASRRWEASSWPLCGRWRERMGVSRWAWPLDRCRARRVTPAARRWVAEA